MNRARCHYDVAIIGAGAAGLMCAITAGQRGRRVLVLDHGEKIGEKIRISGGGRCNFTNIDSKPKNFLSQNPKFCISALKRFGPDKIIAMLDKHAIEWHDKGAGQLFCNKSATQVIEMLLAECANAGVRLKKNAPVSGISRQENCFRIEYGHNPVTATSLVIATGGLSIPKTGASGFGHTVARQFGHTVTDLRPGLVPLTFSGPLLDSLKTLSGVSVTAQVTSGKKTFHDELLFTHRGMSGPAILQISSYWHEGLPISINLCPGLDIFEKLSEIKSRSGKKQVSNVLGEFLPTRLVQFICETSQISARLGDMNNKQLRRLADSINKWQVLPQGTEGYRTAEVTLGGVDTKNISSRTMQSTLTENLYFIGEVVDVTGHLGGHNFQWAWASGFSAGQAA